MDHIDKFLNLKKLRVGVNAGEFNIYCDVDDTLITHWDEPIEPTIRFLKEAKAKGARLYLWSQAGDKYCKEVATRLGLEHLFDYFLSKPDLCIDDIEVKSKFISCGWLDSWDVPKLYASDRAASGEAQMETESTD